MNFKCGGAQSRRRPPTLRQRRVRNPRDTTIIASTKSGRQTAKPRKAGARVKSKNAFIGEGTSLVEKDGEGKIKGKGTGFGKQAARCGTVLLSSSPIKHPSASVLEKKEL